MVRTVINKGENMKNKAAPSVRCDRTAVQGTPFRFVGGELNACYNAVDRHVEAGKGSKVALIHDSPLTNTIRRISYAELLDQVRKKAGATRALG